MGEISGTCLITNVISYMTWMFILTVEINKCTKVHVIGRPFNYYEELCL